MSICFCLVTLFPLFPLSPPTSDEWASCLGGDGRDSITGYWRLEGIPGISGRQSGSASCLGEHPFSHGLLGQSCWKHLSPSHSNSASASVEPSLDKCPHSPNQSRGWGGRLGGKERKAVRVVTAPGPALCQLPPACCTSFAWGC